MRVVIVGTGYVGLTTGITLAYLNHQVACVDVDEAKIEQLRGGDLPIYEPYLASNSQSDRIGRRFSRYTQIFADFSARSEKICVDLRASGKSTFYFWSD